MDPIVLAAGTALVGAMATDAWQQARGSVVAWWRLVRSNNQAEDISAELAEVRNQVLTARNEGDEDTERALAAVWQMRLQQLLSEDAARAGELRRLLDDELTPVLPVDEQARVGTIVMKARVSDTGRVYQAGRDQHITE
ncbi:hypothetical protein [Streptomyces lunaelactis]|uniref:hypothetical protein n=1 Tax=Streptomyces lunaelactis TaxID=1535768 RepID=UPI0028169D6C|nr:hypothetical protein [Streptomyces lunaelactis]